MSQTTRGQPANLDKAICCEEKGKKKKKDRRQGNMSNPRSHLRINRPAVSGGQQQHTRLGGRYNLRPASDSWESLGLQEQRALITIGTRQLTELHRAQRYRYVSVSASSAVPATLALPHANPVKRGAGVRLFLVGMIKMPRRLSKLGLGTRTREHTCTRW